MKRFITYIIALTVLAGCEFTFPVNSKGGSGIYLQCICTPDSTMMTAAYAAPAGGNAKDIPDLEPTRMEMSIGGQAVLIDGETVYCKAGAGDRIEVRIDAKGMEGIMAYTTMPSVPQLKDITLGNDLMMGVKIKTFEFALDHQPSDGEYFAFMIFKSEMVEHEREEDDELEGTVMVEEVSVLKPVIAASTDPEVELAQVAFFDSMIKNESDSSLTVVPAKAFKDGKLTLTTMDFSAVMPERDENGNIIGPPSFPDTDTGTGEGTTPELEPDLARYRFIVYSVSESFYRYSLARYKSRSDFLAMMGLAPANFAWSNVKGGFGVCAAINGIQTDWYTDDTILH